MTVALTPELERLNELAIEVALDREISNEDAASPKSPIASVIHWLKVTRSQLLGIVTSGILLKIGVGWGGGVPPPPLP